MRSRTLLGVACLAAALLVLHGGQNLPADPPKETKAADQPQPDKTNARWQVGMKWVVETTTDLTQLGDEAKKKPQKTEPINWQFTVVKIEKVHGHDCFRVKVERLVGEGDKAEPVPPVTTIWADAQNLTLRQIRTEFVVQGQIREVTESYEFGNGQPAPVMSPLTSIPLDMPLLRPGGATKAAGSETFSYAANSGPAGKKALGDVGFAVEIKQDVVEVPAGAKALGGPDFTVKMSSGDRTVTQEWKNDKPWPETSNNGTTTSKLKSVTMPKN
jgi:hypothetical protein